MGHRLPTIQATGISNYAVTSSNLSKNSIFIFVYQNFFPLILRFPPLNHLLHDSSRVFVFLAFLSSSCASAHWLLRKSSRAEGDKGPVGDGDPGFVAAAAINHAADPCAGSSRADRGGGYLLLASQGRYLLQSRALQGHPYN